MVFLVIEKSNENADDYNDAKAKDDDYDDDEGNVESKDDQRGDDDDEGDEKENDDEVEVVEQFGKRTMQDSDEDYDKDEDTEGETKGAALDDQTVDAAADVVEDSEGKMALDKKPGRDEVLFILYKTLSVCKNFGVTLNILSNMIGHADNEDEANDDDVDDDEINEGDFQEMGKQISKLKKVFNEDMPNVGGIFQFVQNNFV